MLMMETVQLLAQSVITQVRVRMFGAMGNYCAHDGDCTAIGLVCNNSRAEERLLGEGCRSRW